MHAFDYRAVNVLEGKSSPSGAKARSKARLQRRPRRPAPPPAPLACTGYPHCSTLRRGWARGRRIVCLEWLHLISSLYSFLYSVALALGMVVSLPYWLYQMVRHGKYRKGLAERLGRVPSRIRLPAEHEPVVWVHA